MPKSLVSRFSHADTVVEIHKTSDPLILKVKRFFDGVEKLSVEKMAEEVASIGHKLISQGWSKEL